LPGTFSLCVSQRQALASGANSSANVTGDGPAISRNTSASASGHDSSCVAPAQADQQLLQAAGGPLQGAQSAPTAAPTSSRAAQSSRQVSWGELLLDFPAVAAALTATEGMAIAVANPGAPPAGRTLAAQDAGHVARLSSGSSAGMSPPTNSALQQQHAPGRGRGRSAAICKGGVAKCVQSVQGSGCEFAHAALHRLGVFKPTQRKPPYLLHSSPPFHSTSPPDTTVSANHHTGMLCPHPSPPKSIPSSGDGLKGKVQAQKGFSAQF
jgi:hypothetical protein